MHSRYMTLAALGLFVAATHFVAPQAGFAKSLYVNKDLNANSPISAYDIQPAPNYLVWQQTSTPTHYGGAGLAIDTDSETLFVTFEGYGTLDIVDAKTLGILGQVTAPNAYNLAGIVVDQDKQKVYAVDRSTDHLYVYSWDATTSTLTNDITAHPYYVALPGINMTYPGGAYGLALDETNDLLYVGDLSAGVKVFNTADWSPAGTVAMSTQNPMAVALDVAGGLLYTGNAYPGYGCTGHLVKTDLATAVESTVNVRALTGGVSTDCVVGIAVDPLTSLVYITTGNQAYGGSDRIIVFDSNLVDLHYTGDIGNPTGIVVPGKEISFNPLNLSKDDGLADDECVGAGGALTYAVCFDNAINANPVDNVVIEDILPAGVDFQVATNSGVYDSVDHKVTWSIGSLPAGYVGDCVFLDVLTNSTLVAGSTFTNSASIQSDQTPPTTQNETTLVCANSPPVADANGPYVGVEGTPVGFDGSGSSDPDGDPLSYEWSFGDGFFGFGVSSSHVYADNGGYAVGLTVSDGSLGASDATTAAIANVPPDLGPLSGPIDPIAVNTPTSVAGSFFDAGVLDTHTAVCDWGDLTTSAATVDETGGSGTIEADHSYAAPGVYTIECTVTDKDGDSDSSYYLYAVVYDPDDGFVTGGGWIWSAPGAYVPDPSLEGKATFGFVSKYKKGATVPTGSTEFQFHAGDLNFHSSSYDWLVIAGAKAKYKGSGTINGGGNYGFMLSAIDAKLTPSTDVDLFWMKIWDKENGDAVVYDNQTGDAMDVDPVTAIGGGSIVIHNK